MPEIGGGLRCETTFLLAHDPHRVAVFGNPGQGYVLQRTEAFGTSTSMHTNVVSSTWFGYTTDPTTLPYRYYRALEQP